MKNFIILFLLCISSYGIAQVKSTGVLNLNANMTAKLDLDQATSTATITITNLASSWFGLGFTPNTVTAGNGMPPLVDCVVMRSAADLSDSRFRSTGNGNPDIDAAPNNWAIITNDPGVEPNAIRTIVATRPFNTGDASDVVFDFNATSIYLLYASPGSGNFTLGYHGGGAARGSLNASFATLGVEDFSLKASAVLYPNPSNGSFTVKSKTGVENIDIYSQTGTFIKTVMVNDSGSAEVNVDGLSSGVYLIELKNKDDKSWKKVIIE